MGKSAAKKAAPTPAAVAHSEHTPPATVAAAAHSAPHAKLASSSPAAIADADSLRPCWSPIAAPDARDPLFVLER